MCGIVYSKHLQSSAPVNSLVKIAYLNQKTRGHDGYGFIGLNKQTMGIFRALDEKGLFSFLNQHHYDEILLHHRFPTSTKNTLPSTHPFVIAYQGKRFSFAHNGIVSNALELKQAHYKQGITYTSMNPDGTFNDSEALAWDITRYIAGASPGVNAQGSAAFVCLVTDETTNIAERLYFFRNMGSPLKFYRDETLLMLSSEGDWGRDIIPDTLFYFDYTTQKICTHSSLVIPDGYYSWDEPFSPDQEYDEEEWETWERDSIQEDIRALEMEMNYLVSTGRIEEAAECDAEIDYLREQARLMG